MILRYAALVWRSVKLTRKVRSAAWLIPAALSLDNLAGGEGSNAALDGIVSVALGLAGFGLAWLAVRAVLGLTKRLLRPPRQWRAPPRSLLT
jgi:hypothetical protein